MGTISSSVGLVTGFPIQDTVNKLIALQAGPRDALTAANTTLGNKQTAITTLETLITGLQIKSHQLTGNLLYKEQNITSSNASALSVSSSGQVAAGSYNYTPLRMAQAQQLASSRLVSDTAPLGNGTFSIRMGGFVDQGVSVDLLNGGNGFDPGQIQITDRSGASANVDLTMARSIDDVVQSINNATGIHVTAQAVGNHLRLIDDTGQTTSNLKVSEVNNGTTAASLGLSGINLAANQADGADILSVFNDMSLSNLNHGLGVRFDNALADMNITFRDGTSSTVDFHQLSIPGTKAFGTTQGTLGSNAKLTFTATTAGSAYAGVNITFEDVPGVVAGNETAAYDATSKTLVYHIQAGKTTAQNIIDATKKNSDVTALFTVAAGAGSDKTGLVSVNDTATTAGAASTATTPGSIASNAKILFTAVTPGASGDGVSIQFVDNPSILKGQETVAYDSQNKKLVFQISAGNTTANDVITALNNDPTASQIFKAASTSGSDGKGLISVNDTATTSGGAIIEPFAGTNETTLGDVLNVLNSVAPGKLKAEIAPDGNHLTLTDLTTSNGVSSFSVADLNGSHAAHDLGLTVDASSDTITSQPLLAGLNSTLLRNLNGGKGITGLGLLQLTDRSGATASVDLSKAQTLEDVINGINGANLGIKASINQGHDGLQLTDTTGATASNLIVANGADSTTTADRLGISVNAAQTSFSGSDLKLQVMNENTTLSSLNANGGVPSGTFKITDSKGVTATAQITSSQKTIGDVLNELNSLGLAIHAQINDAGDGIVIQDTGGGTSTLSISEGNSTTASALHLLGSAKTVTINGQPAQGIDGSTTFSITLGATDSLQTLVQKINDAHIGVTASDFNDGTSVRPFQLVLTSQLAGKAGQMRVDTSHLPFYFAETAQAQDALLMVNGQGSSIGHVVTSTTNTFKNILPNATLQINSIPATPTPVTISSVSSDKTLSATLSSMVDGFNSIMGQIKTLTAYDTTSGTKSSLFGDTSVLRVETDLSNLFTNRSFGAGKIQTLQELGLNIQSDGTLVFSQTDFDTKFNADPTAVQNFLNTANTGFADRVKNLANQLAGPTNSVLSGRAQAFAETIKNNQDRIATLTAHLDAEQLRLLNSFYQSELLIGKIRNNLNALSSIANLFAPTTTTTPTTSSSSTTKTA